MEAPSGGINADAAPDFIGRNEAPLIENFLVDRPGRLPMRGPIGAAAVASHDLLVRKPITGRWHAGDNILTGYRDPSGGSREPWVAPYQPVTNAALLAKVYAGSGHGYIASFGSPGSSSHTTGASVDNAPGPRYSRLGDSVWGIGFGVPSSAPATITQNGYVYPLPRLLQWAGTVTNPAVVANAPYGSQDVRTHLNRLWLAGGVDVPGGLTRLEFNTLFFSTSNGPVTGAATDWKDPVSGLVNKIVVDSDGDDFIVGLAKVGRNLAVFKRRSVHLLSGSSPSTFSIRSYSTDLGCIDARSIVEYNEGCFFLSQQGYLWFDGYQLSNVSDPAVRSLIRAAVSQTNGIDGGQAIASRMSNDYVALAISLQSNTDPVTVTTYFCGYYNVRSKSWATFSTNGMTLSQPAHFGHTANYPWLADDRYLRTAQDVFAPITGVTSTVAEVNSTGAAVTIPAKWHSALFRLGTPAASAQLHRQLVDYRSTVPTFKYRIIDGSGVTLVPEVNINSPSLAPLYRQRFIRDTRGTEANDVQVQVESIGGTVPALIAELHSVGLEFQITYPGTSS